MRVRPESGKNLDGAVLRRLRETCNGGKGLTQEGLADLVGVNRNEISRLEKNNRKAPEDLIKKLCSVLGVVESDLLQPTTSVYKPVIETQTLEPTRSTTQSPTAPLRPSMQELFAYLSILSEDDLVMLVDLVLRFRHCPPNRLPQVEKEIRAALLKSGK